MRKRRVLGVLVATLALAVPATADAKKIKHRGSIQGVPTAKVKFSVKKKRGKIVKVANMTFKDLPVLCANGASGTITAIMPSFNPHGKSFTKRGPIRGPGINNGTLRVHGKFRKGGRKAKGNVQIAFKSDAGFGCGTGKRSWKTH